MGAHTTTVAPLTGPSGEHAARAGEPVAEALVARVAAHAVLALSVVLALVEVGRIAVFERPQDVVVAIVATCGFLPLHVWHLAFGLRGERPPGAGWTLAVVAVIQAVALALIGPAWSPMLAALATSALIVLRPAWATATLAACVCAPALAYVFDRDLTAALDSKVSYLMVSVLFRATIQFTLVWLVAGTRALAASRQTAAADAAQREAARIEASMQTSLERSLDRLVGEARDARARVQSADLARAAAALDGLRTSTTEAVAELRRVVSGARRALAPPRPEPGAASPPRPTPIGRGLTLRSARWSFLAVHGVVLGFTLTASLGAFGGPAGNAWVVVPAWVALSGLQLAGALAVAAGRPLRWSMARLVTTCALTVAAVAICGDGWRDRGWFAGAAVAATLRGRARLIALGAVLLVSVTWDAWLTGRGLPGADWGLLAWDVAYVSAITTLGIAGLYGSARLIDLLGRLDEARERHVAAAVDRERRRLWADLHDVLGQTLTAIALKADLARRLLERDPRRTTGELDDLVALATAQADELRAVARGRRALSFDIEASSAVRLLRQAGLQVHCDVDVGELAVDSDTLLGSVAREGTTNILRHSRARHCVMRASHAGDQVVFELRNDGVVATGGDGTGLRGLAERATACGATVTASELPEGWFVLRVAVPVGSSA